MMHAKIEIPGAQPLMVGSEAIEAGLSEIRTLSFAAGSIVDRLRDRLDTARADACTMQCLSEIEALLGLIDERASSAEIAIQRVQS